MAARKTEVPPKTHNFVSIRSAVRKMENPRLVLRRLNCKAEDVSELEARGYILGNTLGEGTYGKVKIATSRHHQGLRVAVKIINKKKAPDEFKNKFLPREIDILTEIQHPNIIKLHDAFTVGKKVYFIMELAGHGDLLEYVKLRNKLTEQRSRFFLTDIVDAISYCHDLGIVHRDLKCENLLLDAHNNIKLTDFGFARRMGPDDVSRTYCGSAAYAAPEILRGVEYRGVKNDIWSIGVILYIMVTGLMPFDDADIPRLIRQQQKKLSFPKTARSLSVSVRVLIRSLLEFDVAQRATMDHIKHSEWFRKANADVPVPVPHHAPVDVKPDPPPFLISQLLGTKRTQPIPEESGENTTDSATPEKRIEE